MKTVAMPSAVLAICVAGALLTPSQAAESDLYRVVADELATAVGVEPMNVSVGNFMYEDGGAMSAYSALLRDELERVLQETGKFKVITRQRLSELRDESRFQAMQIADPDSGVNSARVEGVQGIVRGRFYYKPPEVTIMAELVWLEGGNTKKVRMVISDANAGAQIWPDSQPGTARPSVQSLIEPQNVQQSQANLKDVETRVKAVPHDFGLRVLVDEMKRDFRAGETISYKAWSDVDCHIAVFCHQVDGSTVVLFPNRWSRDTWIPAGKKVAIPGTAKSGFEIVIGAPYGVDVVQVVACTKASVLHRMVSDYVKDASPDVAYRGITRGMLPRAIADSMSEFADHPEPAGPPRWSETHVAVSTYPAYEMPRREP